VGGYIKKKDRIPQEQGIPVLSRSPYMKKKYGHKKRKSHSFNDDEEDEEGDGKKEPSLGFAQRSASIHSQ